MFTADLFLQFLDLLVSTLSILTFYNIYTIIYSTEVIPLYYIKDTAAISTTTTYYYGGISSSDLSIIISVATTTIQLICFLLWLHITLHYLGDILNYCSVVIECIEKQGKLGLNLLFRLNC